MRSRDNGAALVVGLLLLSLITLLGLAGGSAAQVELQLARNELFRENAASAASAGIEIAIQHVIDTASAPASARLAASLPGTADRYEADIRFLGHEILAQASGVSPELAHFEIVATGHAGRGARDRQRAILVHAATGEWRRLSWQRMPAP